MLKLISDVLILIDLMTLMCRCRRRLIDFADVDVDSDAETD